MLFARVGKSAFKILVYFFSQVSSQKESKSCKPTISITIFDKLKYIDYSHK